MVASNSSFCEAPFGHTGPRHFLPVIVRPVAAWVTPPGWRFPAVGRRLSPSLVLCLVALFLVLPPLVADGVAAPAQAAPLAGHPQEDAPWMFLLVGFALFKRAIAFFKQAIAFFRSLSEGTVKPLKALDELWVYTREAFLGLFEAARGFIFRSTRSRRRRPDKKRTAKRGQTNPSRRK